MKRAAGMRDMAASVLAAGAAAFTTAQAADQPPTPQDRPVFEVAAFPGLAFGGSFTRTDTGQSVHVGSHGSFALALDAQADGLAQYELFYSHQSTVLRGDSTLAPIGIAVEYLHVGGIALLDETPHIKPYVCGGLGVTRFSPPAPGLEDTRFSVSLGLGLRVPLSQRFALRLEGRGLVTLVSSSTAIFCASDQSGLLCQIHGHGSTLVQGEALAGIAFTF